MYAAADKILVDEEILTLTRAIHGIGRVSNVYRHNFEGATVRRFDIANGMHSSMYTPFRIFLCKN
jgi:hypothetical protein